MSRLRIPALLVLLAGCDPVAEKHAADAAAFLKEYEGAALRFFQLDPLSHLPSDSVGPRLQSWIILQEKPFGDPAAVGELREILGSSSTFGSQLYDCFTPGMAFRFSFEGKSSDVLICLACSAVRVYGVGRKETWVLSAKGVERLKRIYEAHAIPAKK